MPTRPVTSEIAARRTPGSPGSSGTPRIPGFTLVELLVVVAIIALLLGILLPAVNKARQVAQMTVCGTQVKNLVSVMHTYARENDEEWLVGLNSFTGPGAVIIPSSSLGIPAQFHARISAYIVDEFPPQPTRSAQGGGPELPAWNLVKDNGNFWCPTAPGPEQIPNWAIPNNSANELLGSSIVPNGRFAGIPDRPYGTGSDRMTEMSRPASSVLFADANYLGLKPVERDTGEYSSPMHRHLSTYPTPEDESQGGWEASNSGRMPRGDGQANLGFGDGHVDSVSVDKYWRGRDNDSIRHTLD